jgi:acyl-CoA thioester hydrolase
MKIPEGVYVAAVPVRVGYIDTDRGQIVHHATYLRYLELSRVEYLRERGVDYRRFEQEQALSMPVVEARIRYRSAAQFDDLLTVKTWIAQVNRAKLRFDSGIYRGSELLTTAEITLCCIRSPEQRIVSMPEAIIALGSPAAGE